MSGPGTRGLVVAALCTIVAVGAWFVVTPTDSGALAIATGNAEGDAAAAALFAADETARADGETLSGEAPDAPFSRVEAFAEDDGRARLNAGEVLVLDAQGIALPGAVVEAMAAGATDRRTTDAFGKAAVRLPEAATMSLRARAPGHLPTGRVDHPFGSAATINMVRAARLLASVQDAGGAKVAGVRVAVRGRTRVAGLTSADGSVVLDEIRSGTYDIALTTEAGTGLVRASMVAGLFLAPGDNGHTFTMAKGTTVSGIVRDAATQLPIAAADVRLRWDSRGGGVYGFDHEQRTSTDAAGQFAFSGVAPGRIRVRADTDMHAARAHEQELVSSDGDVQVELALVRAAIVRGVVTDTARQPVANAEVTVGFGENGLHFLNAVSTDAQGRFEIRVAPRDGLLLVATKAGRGPGGMALGKVAAGEVREGIEIEMKRGVAVRGRVRSALGTPLAGAEVNLIPKFGAERFARMVLTSADGTFRFDEVAAFQYRVEARAADHAPAGIDVKVADDRPETDAGELRLARAFVLEGVVVARGAEVGQGAARVSVREVSGKGQNAGAMTDDLGRFSIAELTEGDYLVDVRGPDVVQQTPQRVRVPQRSLLRVPVEAMMPAGTGIIALEVIDPITRQAVAGVQFVGVDGRRVSYADGHYSLRGIPAGRVDLRLQARGYQPLALSGVIVVSGQVRDLHELTLQRAASLRLRVVDERGKPFRAGLVRVQLIDTQGLTTAAALTPSEAAVERGTWGWDGLALSRFELRVRGPDTHVPAVQGVDAFAPQPIELRVRLARKPKPPAKPKPAAGTPPPRK